MLTSSTRKQSLLAACLLSLCLAGCSKDKKKDKEQPESPKAMAAETVPAKSAGDAPVALKSATSGALAYLPAECAIAMHADLRSILANAAVSAHLLPALREGLKKGTDSSKEFASFLDVTGLDPFTNFHEVSGCLGEIPLNGQDPRGVMTVGGKIGSNVFDELVKSSGDLKKDTIIDIKGQKAVDDDGAVFTQMADGSLSGGNDKALITAAIGKPNAFASDFDALGKSDLSIVIPAKTVTMGLGMPGSPFQQFAEKIDGATTVGVDIDKTTLTVKIGTVDEATANELAGMAKLLLGQVPKEGEGMEAGLMAALAAAKTGGEGKQFVMSMKLPADQFEAACKMLAEKIRSEISSGAK